MSDLPYPARMLQLETALAHLEEMFLRTSTNERPWGITIQNPLISFGPVAAPTVGTSAGSVTQDRDYAFSFISTEAAMESALSDPTSVSLSSEQADISGERSTDRRVDLIGIYTRMTGGTELDWRRVTTVANPSSGTWSYGDDEPYSAYIGETPPLSFVRALQAVCGTGYKVRRVKILPNEDYEADPSNYWILGVDVRRNGQTLARLTVRQDTTEVGFQASKVYNIPNFHLRAEVPGRRDLDIAVAEDEGVYFYLRGVGSPEPLPLLLAMVDVTREVT